MSITRSLQLLIVVVVAGACFVVIYRQTPTLASQLLLNGGFEDGGLTPDQWQNIGGTLERVSSPDPNRGYSAALTSTSQTSKWIYQTVTVTAGNPYTLTAYALKDNAEAASVFLRIRFYDAAAEPLSEAGLDQPFPNSPEFQLLTLGPVTAPDRAVSARVMGVVNPRTEAA
ncbi:MAG TPA: hypothetical protein VJA25_09230, partial [Dehalococcoidia bacterium]|nr:hypothetical protein [Dehalococcoidia bacterium]